MPILQYIRQQSIGFGAFQRGDDVGVSVGTFGVFSYTVAQSRRAIGVRMALGAAPSRILIYFLSLGTELVAAGVVPGVLGAWVAGRSMRNLLFAVGPGNPGVLAATAGVMCGVVLPATILAVPTRHPAVY